MSAPVYTLDDSRRDHPNWWHPDAMRFFRTRVSAASETPVTLPRDPRDPDSAEPYPAVLFVTSEEPPGGGRRYAIRLHGPDRCYTVGGLLRYATRAEAVRELRHYAANPITLLEAVTR